MEDEADMPGDAHIVNNSGPATIEVVGGALCLDFANTVEGREGPRRVDFIRDPGDLIVWARRVGAIPESGAALLTEGHEQHPETLARSFDTALAVRETIYQTFAAIVRGSLPRKQDLDLLREQFGEAIGQAQLVQDELQPRGAYGWRWRADNERLFDVLRWRVVGSAIELLQSGPLDRLKQCPGSGDTPCNWLFIDETRGGNRRWCSMSDCGARAKWTRQNARRRATSQAR
jgi:predicted RNA-binding Zn ribbon-like protein